MSMMLSPNNIIMTTTLPAPPPIVLPDHLDDDECVNDAEQQLGENLKQLEPEATVASQQQKQKICDAVMILDSLMLSEGKKDPFVASHQILLHCINEHLPRTGGEQQQQQQLEYDTLLTAAYRAGLYADESTGATVVNTPLKAGAEALPLFNGYNEGKFGEKGGWVPGTDLKIQNDGGIIIEMISYDENEAEKKITKVDCINSQLGGGANRGGYIRIMNVIEEGNADGGQNGGDGKGGNVDQGNGGLMRGMGTFNGNGLMTGSILTIGIAMLMNWLAGTISNATFLDAKEDCLLSASGSFWNLIGLVGFFFLAAATISSGNETESALYSRKKRIKTRASIHCGRKTFSLLLQLLFYFGLTDTTHALSKSYFAWTTDGGKDYKDYCSVVVGAEEWSCLCLNGDTWTENPSNGRKSVFICDHKCDKVAHKVEGYCAQCAAGTFWGNYYTEGESGYKRSNKVCPSNDPDTCTCGIFTHSPSSSSTYYFEYVCTHSADSGPPRNQVGYNDDIGNRFSGQCSTCPAGTQSRQGDWVCVACEKGKYSSSPKSEICQYCPPGEYSDGTGFTYCKVCQAGQFSNNGKDQDGSTGCMECPAGYYSTEGSSGCTSCPAGHYTNKATGATTCTPASIGYYVGATNANSLPHLQQYECPIGSYTSTPGQAHCTSCPPNTSTHDTRSTSLSDCISCPYGVNSNTFDCLSTPLGNNTCWDAGQVLSMDNSTAIENLYSRVYNLPDVGINALIRDAMSVIQGAAQRTSTIEDIQTVLDKLKNAPENWLSGLSDDFDSCVASTANELMRVANSDQKYDTNLFQYQFGDNYAQNRAEWIAKWQCKGATFGCTTDDTLGCPQAKTCFDPLYKYFASILSFGGGTFFGNYQKLNTGRYTPEYSPSFIAQQLDANVKSLVQWNNAATSFRRFYTLMGQIEDGEEFTANAIAAVLQVQNVSTSVSLESSHTVGNLYYQQAVYNYNQTFQIAQIVQYGPAYCPDGYEITSEGIPNGCTDFETLVEQCRKDLFKDAILNLIKDTMKLAAGLVQPLPGTATKTEIALFKGFNSINNLIDESTTLLDQPWITGGWDPNTEIPPPPDIPGTSDDSVAFENQEYADACYQWYLDGQKKLSDSLIVWSPAKWEAIYLESEKQYDPVLLNPPPCDQKTKIVTALNDYLLNVQSMSNYGSSMTAAEMSLVPVMGNIAAGIATEAAIINANEQISGMVHKPNPDLNDTAPSEYQSAYETLFFTPYEDISKAILAYGPSASLAQQQYIASKSIYGFCTSYSYMNAGQDYVDTTSGNTANCKEFGGLYLPTYETFNETVNSFVNEPCSSDPDNCYPTPTSVNGLNKNIVDFAANVQGNPEALGQTRSEVSDNIETFTLEFAYDPNTTTAYYGNLADGKIRFTLTPSSSLLLESNNPFVVYDANPRVINVQTYWGGVTSPSPYNQFLETTINPVGPYMLYPDPSGVGMTYALPPYLDGGDLSSSDSVFFAQFRSIQRQDSCGTDFTSVETLWRNGEQLQFCTPYSKDLKQPFAGIAEYAFLFPSMWSTWEVEADHTEWISNKVYSIDESELALQVVFRYVASSNPSQSGGPNKCALNCLSTQNIGALPGQEWCDRNSCNDCPASHSYNGTQLVTVPFCHCNVWDGSYGTCIPGTATTNMYSMQFQSTDNNLRRQLKKKGSDKTEETSKSAKAGKSEMMSEMAEGLEELLQIYLGKCDGDTANSIIGSNAVVQISECTKGKGKKVTCDFYLTIPSYGDEAESVGNKEQANSCIIATFQESDAVKEALTEFDICDATVSVHDDNSNKEEMIAEWNSCSPFK